MSKTPTLLACAAIAIALAAPLSADAGPKQEARVHIDRATKAHKAGDLEKALTELQAAYALDPQPQLLYAMGQIYTKLGRCSEASDSYLRFLASGADARTAGVVKQAIESCKPGGAGEPAASKEPTPPPKEPAAEPKEPPASKGPTTPSSDDEDPLSRGSRTTANPPPPEKSPRPVSRSGKRRVSTLREDEPAGPPPPPEGERPWYTDTLGDVLVVGGVASLVLGGLAYRAARADLDAAETVNTHERYQELVDGAHTKRLVGVTLAGAGAVLVTAGVLRFKLRDKHTEVRRVGMVPARGGGLLTWTRSF